MEKSVSYFEDNKNEIAHIGKQKQNFKPEIRCLSMLLGYSMGVKHPHESIFLFGQKVQ